MAKWGALQPSNGSLQSEIKKKANADALKSVREEYHIAIEEGEHAIAARLERLISKMEAEQE